jgi:Ca2+-transporting ATPase
MRNKWLMGGLALGILLQFAVIYAPPLNASFHTVPIPPADLLSVVACASLVLWLEELRKIFARRRAASSAS